MKLKLGWTSMLHTHKIDLSFQMRYQQDTNTANFLPLAGEIWQPVWILHIKFCDLTHSDSREQVHNQGKTCTAFHELILTRIFSQINWFESNFKIFTDSKIWFLKGKPVIPKKRITAGWFLFHDPSQLKEYDLQLVLGDVATVFLDVLN